MVVNGLLTTGERSESETAEQALYITTAVVAAAVTVASIK